MINENIFNELVLRYNNSVNKNNTKYNIEYLLIEGNDKLFIHNFNDTEKLCDIRSITKTVMTLVCGIISKESNNEFNENTFIWPIIKDHVNLENTSNLAYLKQIQIKHLLTHTIGYSDVLLMRNDIEDIDKYSLVDYVINYDIKHKPGTYYLYSNAGFYLLSVVMELYLNESLEAYIIKHLFSKLNISDYKFEYYGNYLAGATRLYLYPQDLLKIAKVIKANDNTFVSKDWIEMMKTLSNKTEHHFNEHRVLTRYGYGHGLWLNKDRSIFFGHGTDSQIMLMFENIDLFIITLASDSDNNVSEEILNDYIESVVIA